MVHQEPMTGGSAIQGYMVDMETDVNPGWTTIYDGSLDPNVKQPAPEPVLLAP